MTEQEENELICSKLLGWKRVGYMPDKSFSWLVAPELIQRDTPSFTTWAETGLILDALSKKASGGDYVVTVSYRIGDGCWYAYYTPWSRQRVAIQNGATGPLAIRAAALAYIRAAPQAGARHED